MVWLLRSCGIMVAAMVLWAGVGLAAPPPTIAHHLSLRLDPSRHRLEAVDRVTVEESQSSRLDFLLADHLSVAGVWVNGAPADYAYKQGRLQVLKLPQRPPYRIDIEYSGVFDDEIPMDPVNTHSGCRSRIARAVRTPDMGPVSILPWLSRNSSWPEARSMKRTKCELPKSVSISLDLSGPVDVTATSIFTSPSG